jgi:transcription initiation factor TFIIA small subunit
MEYALILSL